MGNQIQTHKTMKIAHFSDLHYCAKHLRWVDAAFAHAIAHAKEHGAEMAVISGDSFDAAISLHEPAVNAFIRRVKELADSMPVLVLQGTHSHDRPGSLAPLRAIGGNILVAEHICQAALMHGGWMISEGHAFLPDDVPGALALFSCLPSVNKGGVAAALGADVAGEKTGDVVRDLCASWAPANEAARTLYLPTIMVSHGTVNGCITETARAMISPDHEFTAPTLFSAGTTATMLGHIHAHQGWEDAGRLIAYPGSITKMIYGHKGQTGYLLWDVGPVSAAYDHIPCPSREMIEVEFPGMPDMEVLAENAFACDGAYVRVRCSVDEEHRASVDRDAIQALFSAAEEVKIEVRVNPVQRQRAAGISQETTLASKLVKWCEFTNTDPAPLLDRLDKLQAPVGGRWQP
jgi:exonuclease SbcD